MKNTPRENIGRKKSEENERTKIKRKEKLQRE
jgi:hypothetical protein